MRRTPLNPICGPPHSPETSEGACLGRALERFGSRQRDRNAAGRLGRRLVRLYFADATRLCIESVRPDIETRPAGLDARPVASLTQRYRPANSGFAGDAKLSSSPLWNPERSSTTCRTATAGPSWRHRKISRGAKLRRVGHDRRFRRQDAARMIDSGRAGDRCDPGQRRGRRQCHDL
jgi:hypothetical protein